MKFGYSVNVLRWMHQLKGNYGGLYRLNSYVSVTVGPEFL